MSKKIFLSIGIVVAVAGGSRNVLAQNVGQFRGTQAFTESIVRRLFVGTASFNIGPYLGISINPYGENLSDLLGIYLARGTNSQFVNAEPNPVNLLLWEIVAQGLSRDLGSLCAFPGGGPSLLSGMGTLKPELIAAARDLCQWSDTSARSEAKLEALWLALMRYDAPEAEYLAFRDFFMAAPQLDENSGVHLASMVYAVLMNPYFVLRR